jgi:hypothetical protein
MAKFWRENQLMRIENQKWQMEAKPTWQNFGGKIN